MRNRAGTRPFWIAVGLSLALGCLLAGLNEPELVRPTLRLEAEALLLAAGLFLLVVGFAVDYVDRRFFGQARDDRS